MKLLSVLRNIKTALMDPEIIYLYISWCVRQFCGRSSIFEIRGAKIGGFPNFSAYLGAVRNALTRHEIEFVISHIGGAEIIFDVGANFGAFAIPVARLAPTARVYAFEPNPYTATALRENLLRNEISNVVVVECAFSHSDGEIKFSDSSDPATNRIVGDDEVGIAVQCRSLASFCTENFIDRIDFLKIDVEGAELDVLDGAKDLFLHKKIMSGMIEVCPGNLKVFGRGISDLNLFMKVAEYRIEFIGEAGVRDDRDVILENAGFFPTGAG